MEYVEARREKRDNRNFYLHYLIQGKPFEITRRLAWYNQEYGKSC